MKKVIFKSRLKTPDPAHSTWHKLWLEGKDGPVALEAIDRLEAGDDARALELLGLTTREDALLFCALAASETLEDYHPDVWERLGALGVEQDDAPDLCQQFWDEQDAQQDTGAFWQGWEDD